MLLRKIMLSLCVLTIGSVSVALADQPASLFNSNVAQQSYTVIGAKGTAGSAALQPSTTALKPSTKQLINTTPQINSVINPDANGVQEALLATQGLKKSLNQVAEQQILFQQQMQTQVQQLQQENTMLANTIQELYGKITAMQVQKTPVTPDAAAVNNADSMAQANKSLTFTWYLELLSGACILVCLSLLAYVVLRRSHKNATGYSKSGAN